MTLVMEVAEGGNASDTVKKVGCEVSLRFKRMGSNGSCSAFCKDKANSDCELEKVLIDNKAVECGL